MTALAIHLLTVGVALATPEPAGGAAPSADAWTLRPRAFSTVATDAGRVTCFNASAQEATLSLAPELALVEPAGLTCADDDGFACTDADGVVRLRCARAVTAPDASASPEPELQTVFVLDFKLEDVTPEAAAIVADLTTSELARHPKLAVLSGEDVRRMLQLEASKQAVGCTEEGCLAEMAGAMGARYLVSGNVSRTAGPLQVDLSLVDTEEVKAVSRESVQARDLEDLSRRLPVGVRNLLVPAYGGERSALPPVDLGRQMGDAGTFVDAGVAGLGAAALGGVAWLPLVALQFLLPVFDALFCIGCCGSVGVMPLTCLSGAGVAALVDKMAGYPVSWGRALLTGGVGGCVSSTGFLAALFVGGGAVILYAAESGAPSDTLPEFLALLPIGIVTALVGTGVAVVLGWLAGAVAYDVGIGVFGDGPKDVSSTARAPAAPRDSEVAVAY